MYDDLRNEKIIIDIDSYCEFMKEVILNTSGLN